ncbi:universal stress protein [Nonomuraea sp. PA05]|uniref:universal stress protein n=1 Tax=Nonomuraea sp. PA05 TaxID=2604466 RepID=UPI0011D56802|nr:universal stress protein [Nonomuraea sp. PA05]TYB66773.1 universal stress protein [Nonomuraea sp. PA05]
MNPVTVGVDDSEDSLRAVEWAAAEAVRRGRPLLIVHAFIWPMLNVPLGPAPGAPPEGGLRHAAERVLDNAAARARAAAPEAEVTTEMPEGEPFVALVRHSRHAELLVVGSRGLGEVGGLLLSSVGARLAIEAACPVVVVRGSAKPDEPVAGGTADARPGGPVMPVVAGVAGPGDSEAVLAFACAHAARTGQPLMLAHAGAAGPDGHARPPLPEPDLARWRKRFPTVTIDQETLTGRPGKALTDAASSASLLVVGSHHHHELSALWHGSVSQHVLHHATCPVAIVRTAP